MSTNRVVSKNKKNKTSTMKNSSKNLNKNASNKKNKNNNYNANTNKYKNANINDNSYMLKNWHGKTMVLPCKESTGTIFHDVYTVCNNMLTFAHISSNKVVSDQQVNVQMVESEATPQINNDLQDEVITMESNKYVLSDMVYDQNNRLTINKELWIQSCLLLEDRRNDEVKSVIQWCENITYLILQMKPEWAYKGQSTFFLDLSLLKLLN